MYIPQQNALDEIVWNAGKSEWVNQHESGRLPGTVSVTGIECGLEFLGKRTTFGLDDEVLGNSETLNFSLEASEPVGSILYEPKFRVPSKN